MGLRLLEIVVKNGTELQNVHRTHSLKTYPVVFIGDKDGNIYYDSESEKQKPVDVNGGSNPVWDAYDEFHIDTDEALQKKLYLFVGVESLRNMACLGSKFVGEVRVAIEDLLKDFGDAVDKKSVTESVRNKKGEAHGNVTFKYKFGPQLADPPQPADPAFPKPPADNGRRNSNGLVRAVAGGVASGLITTVAEIILNET